MSQVEGVYAFFVFKEMKDCAQSMRMSFSLQKSTISFAQSLNEP